MLKSYVALAATVEATEEIGNSLVVREPVGVVAAITPWNYPLHQIVAKVGAALAAGCTVVVKPAELTPLTAYLLVDAAHEAGLPPGVLNLVTGTGPVVGAALAGHPGVDMVSFTGSTATGAQVTRAAADRIAHALTDAGYATTTTRVRGPMPGVQICQHHCPVSHVAEQFPELCEAEQEAMAEVLGTHVQRLATIVNGDCACTTHVPLVPAQR